MKHRFLWAGILTLAIGAISQVETEAAYKMAKRLAREEGLLVGISAAANVAAALRLRGNRRPIPQYKSRYSHCYNFVRFRRQIPERAILGGVRGRC